MKDKRLYFVAMFQKKFPVGLYTKNGARGRHYYTVNITATLYSTVKKRRVLSEA